MPPPEDRLVPRLTPDLLQETAWPQRLQPLLDVLKEIGCEPLAVVSQRLLADAPVGNLTLCTVVRPKGDLQRFLDDLRAAIHRRPNDNELWRDVCGALRFVKVPEGLRSGLRTCH